MGNLTEVKEAAARLAKQEDAKAHYATLEAVVNKAGDLPVKLWGTEAAWLNPMLELSREDPETYKTLVDWANKKRMQRGLTPLITESNDFDKTEYMREFMAQKRERERKALAIENASRPARDMLRGRSREDFLRKVAREWKAERDRMIAAAKAAAGRDVLSKPETQEVLRLFWEKVDAQLEVASRRR